MSYALQQRTPENFVHGAICQPRQQMGPTNVCPYISSASFHPSTSHRHPRPSQEPPPPCSTPSTPQVSPPPTSSRRPPPPLFSIPPPLGTTSHHLPSPAPPSSLPYSSPAATARNPSPRHHPFTSPFAAYPTPATSST
ncbi:hypothetical protein HPP92_017948 [Vanilla planifolia]|uniref:Uncharacterized protein n=1 Tax=Vanilla planifolia TaxID=51239 RepID=A0A835QCJ1_VANPL|nr:hypothetical protein HPP92_017948 [Vanilla planifolia]